LYIYTFSGRLFWQHSVEERTTRMAFKRKIEDAACYPALKRARMMQLSFTYLEDAAETGGALGNTTSSTHSKFAAQRQSG
jgi:hypothetical protein